MSTKVSNKINMIFSSLVNSEYNGNVHNHHFAVSIRNGKVISPVSCNYSRQYIFGKIRGTCHAEMSSLNYIINSARCYINHKLESYVLQDKGIF